MRLLLDTCTFLWMGAGTEFLSKTARRALEDSENMLTFHQVSAWEIQLKCQTGKLVLNESPRELIKKGIHLYGINYRPLEDEEIWHLQKLPDHHRDPFDRLLISCALLQGLKLVTPDLKIHQYPVSAIWE